MKGMLGEFREFALRGNVLDLAIGVIIGAAFSALVSSFTSDILMPPLELLRTGEFANLFIVLRQGTVPPPYPSLAAATEAGAVTMNIGSFIDAVVAFLITAFALFILIRAINMAQQKRDTAETLPPAPTVKPCPYCLSDLPIAATRCAYCTSHLSETDTELVNPIGVQPA